jgi:hypothetical protein
MRSHHAYPSEPTKQSNKGGASLLVADSADLGDAASRQLSWDTPVVTLT